MKGFYGQIEEQTVKNKSFRKVIYTSAYSQLVLMSLKPGEAIGMENHGNDQFFRFESGVGQVVIDGNKYSVKDGSAVVVPAGAKHNVINTSKVDDLKLYTIYSPPHHHKGVELKTKAAANKSSEEFDGSTTE